MPRAGAFALIGPATRQWGCRVAAPSCSGRGWPRTNARQAQWPCLRCECWATPTRKQRRRPRGDGRRWRDPCDSLRIVAVTCFSLQAIHRASLRLMPATLMLVTEGGCAFEAVGFASTLAAWPLASGWSLALFSSLLCSSLGFASLRVASLRFACFSSRLVCSFPCSSILSSARISSSLFCSACSAVLASAVR
jgi:hypothetical protein